MRQRKLVDLDERMANLAEYIDKDGAVHKGKWREVFESRSDSDSDSDSNGELCLELGCGKGKFIYEMAREIPGRNLIGIEGQESVIVRAAEKLKREPLPNVYLVSSYVRDIRDYFEEGELDGIFLNFSDPWPKARHAKRRLTYHENLKGYMEVLRPGGFIEFKTDNDGLFEFTLEEIEELGYPVDEISRDLHADGLDSARFTTEYEEKFIKKGAKIKYVRIIKE
ncbi:MAG: tRNA (guanosine(46)-N7)-methyltransferase TrmB [Firmicutes bacterium]|nr:tRNA (guanosine(46)-N7)-methyltransferase TrmB [Bacillota bacterium]